jgi:hypothetical protein
VIAPSPEPPMVDVPDEVPLSPRSPQRAAEPAAEPKAWSPSRTGSASPRGEAAPSRPAPEQAKKDDFDLVWPDRNSPPVPSRREDAARREEAKREAMPEAPPAPPPPSVRPRESRPLAGPKAGERGPAILKSGVIDGMPYTLYADGSIEAELPQGTVKFASVDALRAHLEKQS